MKNKKIYIIPLLILLLLSFWTTLALASGDQSNTPGIPGQKPLSFVGAYLANGSNAQNAVNVPLNPTKVSVDGKFEKNYLIKLSFDKNVVNDLVWVPGENQLGIKWIGNTNCFSMYTGSESIPIKVDKIDDTLDFDQRQNVFVAPINPLKPGTTYRIFVSPDLIAKNQNSFLRGTTNGQGVTIFFTTAGQPSLSSNSNNKNNVPSTSTQSNTTKSPSKSSVSSPAANVSAKDSGNQKTESKGANKRSNSKSLNKAAIAKALNNADDEAGSNNNWIVYVGLVLLTAWLAVEVYLKKKKTNLFSKAYSFTKKIFQRR